MMIYDTRISRLQKMGHIVVLKILPNRAATSSTEIYLSFNWKATCQPFTSNDSTNAIIFLTQQLVYDQILMTKLHSKTRPSWQVDQTKFTGETGTG